MVMLSLLKLPLELPLDSPARSAGLESFLTGLPEWISSCACGAFAFGMLSNATQVNLSRAVYPTYRALRPMELTLSALWPVCVSLASRTRSSRSKQRPIRCTTRHAQSSQGTLIFLVSYRGFPLGNMLRKVGLQEERTRWLMDATVIG